jgi:2-keto-4-pentenoate hydratase/2-oxohepta-3-ene-1,7-dioic acid hydratase in catechol pathway
MRATSYRLATYADSAGQPQAGIVVDERMFNAAAALKDTGGLGPGYTASSVLQILQHWDEVHPQLKRVAQAVRSGAYAAPGLPLGSTPLMAPVLYPGAVFCAGANYKDHVAEMSKALNLPAEPDPHELGLKPWHFLKPPIACVRGPGATIELPRYSKKVDWEAEIAVVIGRECRNVSLDAALGYVAGLSIVNDLSARDHLRRDGLDPKSPFYFDWVSQKAFDGALPFGPWITPLEEISDVGQLGIKLWVNDELMQDSSSSNLIFSMAEQISHLSTRLTLRPGDVIATGTPAGCGTARGRFLKAGDRVEIWVEHIGKFSSSFT